MQRSELRSLLQEQFPRERTYLLPIFHYLQHEFGHLPGWALQIVGWHLRVPASEIYGAATSYSELRLDEPTRHVVRVCTGLGCWYAGGRELLESLRTELGIAPVQAHPDAHSNGICTLEETPCGFLCPMAPVVEVDGHWIGRAQAGDIVQRVNSGD